MLFAVTTAARAWVIAAVALAPAFLAGADYLPFAVTLVADDLPLITADSAVELARCVTVIALLEYLCADRE